MSDNINILSITGGGIRGLLTLYVLKDLEDKLDKPLHTYFEYIAGTSTGGIIAIMLSCGYSVSHLIDLYETHGSSIFCKRPFRLGWFRPKYDDEYFNNILKDYLDGAETKTNLIVPSYNYTKKSKRIFNSYDPKDDSVSLFEVARSTSSAPSFFKPIKIEGDYYIDGGLVINNPSQLAYTEAIKFINSRNTSYKKVNVFSFGTGRLDTEEMLKKNGGGKIFWAKASVDILLNEQAKTTDYFMSKMYKYQKGGKYFNIEPVIEKSSSKLDDASASNMVDMKLDGEKSAELNSKNIRKIANTLRK
jgi:patatin-like phospholipase/acyl hydrolase